MQKISSPKNRFRTKREKRPFRTALKDFGKGILLATVIGVLIFGIEYGLAWLLFWIIGRDNLTTPLWNAIYQALIYAITLTILLTVPRWLSTRITKKSPKTPHSTTKTSNILSAKAEAAPDTVATTSREELGLSDLPTWTDLGLAPIGLFVYFLAAAALVALFKFFPWFDAEQAQDVGFNGIYAATDRIIAFVALVVIAPIAEEIIFRGFLYGKLRNRLGIIPSMFIVALLFAVLHGQWNVGVNVFALSLVLCGLREITGTIYSGIIVHMLKNALAFYLLYLVM